MLGHVSIGTTEIYTYVSIVKQIHEMTHPTLHQKQDAETEPDRSSASMHSRHTVHPDHNATEEDLLSTLEAESVEED